MPSESQIVSLINDVIRRTVKGTLKWSDEPVPSSLARGTEDIIDDYFETKLKGQTLAVYERKFRAYDGDRDESYWTSQARFGIVRGGSVLWDTSDEQQRIWTLLQAARESAADIDVLFDELLGKEPD